MKWWTKNNIDHFSSNYASTRILYILFNIIQQNTCLNSYLIFDHITPLIKSLTVKNKCYKCSPYSKDFSSIIILEYVRVFEFKLHLRFPSHIWTLVMFPLKFYKPNLLLFMSFVSLWSKIISGCSCYFNFSSILVLANDTFCDSSTNVFRKHDRWNTLWIPWSSLGSSRRYIIPPPLQDLEGSNKLRV